MAPISRPTRVIFEFEVLPVAPMLTGPHLPYRMTPIPHAMVAA